ncbi:unnamed protein product [Clavelina lepadiformis]|uniref:Uncharacterized protein n=1 Tax=Clavelina lepadiformis TaxID=159417 RepID=A0ABP0FB28_CLALP
MSKSGDIVNIKDSFRFSTAISFWCSSASCQYKGARMTKQEVLTGPLETSSKKPCCLHTCTKEQLLEYFENTYTLDEWLFSSLKEEGYFYKCPDRLRLPLIFYYCHPAVVYVNKLILADLIQERVNENFEAMFETGVDEMSWDDTENYRMGGSYKWPTVAEVVEYRQKVRDIVRSVIQERELTLPVTQDSPWWAVWMGIEHERIHLETSSVLIRQLPVSMVTKPVGWKYGPLSTGEPVLRNPMLKQPPTEVRLGMDDDWPVWGWDNEYGCDVVSVPKFEASKYMVTNREMLAFIRANGYQQRNYWTDEGWKWKEFRQAKHPAFWVCNEECKSNCGADLALYSHCNTQNTKSENMLNEDDGDNNEKYWLRLMFDITTLPLDWPVEVNFHEAKAFCAWKGDDYRLPTEAEEHVLRGLPDFDPENVKTDPIYAKELAKLYNINLVYGSSTPVNFYPKSTSGCYDTFGNVWEWIEDHFNGIPGFHTNQYYHDFSTPCFDGKHNMILGGSWISTGIEASRFARFSFRRHFIQHAGFRLARSISDKTMSPANVVDTPVYILDTKSLDKPDTLSPTGVVLVRRQSTNSHYVSDTADNVATFIDQQYGKQWNKTLAIFKRIRSLTWEAAQSGHASRVLLVGCGPGRLGFELSAFCDKVIACDTSSRCIYVANELKANGRYHCNAEDGVVTKNEIDVITIPDDAKSERIEFKLLTWIPFELKDFNVVINTMLDRAQNPRAWLLRMKELVTSGRNGRAIVVSKQWKPEHLRKDFEPSLQLLMDEEHEADDDVTCSLSVWGKAPVDEAEV